MCVRACVRVCDVCTYLLTTQILLEKCSFAQKVDENWRESERLCEEIGQQLKKRTEELRSAEEEREVLKKKLEEAEHSIQGTRE